MLHGMLVVDNKNGQWYNKGHSNNANVLAYNIFALLKQLWRLLICNTLGVSHAEVAVVYGFAVRLRGTCGGRRNSSA
jgi:hypothetical protein